MTTAFTRRALTGLLLLSIVSPLAAFADDHDNWRNRNRNWNHQNYKQAQKYQKKQYQNYKKAVQRRDRSYWRNHWGNNWNDQRDWYQHNFNTLQARSANERQRQLEAQMRAQYLLYNNNNYNGPYGWSQYSDPRFLDYLHTRQPGLLTTIRSMIGI